MSFFLLDPLEQFHIVSYLTTPDLDPLDFFTYLFFNGYFHNYIIYMFLACLWFYFIYGELFWYNVGLYPRTPWEQFAEDIYCYCYNVIFDTMHTDAYFIFLMNLFFFILFCNLVGLTPYGFTTTSFFFKTFIISWSIFIACLWIGFWTHGARFANIFVPEGVPQALLPFLVVIEIISYCCRPLSLGVRLFANMMAGHSLLNILSSFCLSLSKKSIFFGLFPFIIIVLIAILEFGIAFLQAYIFIILSCIYLSSSIKPEH